MAMASHGSPGSDFLNVGLAWAYQLLGIYTVELDFSPKFNGNPTDEHVLYARPVGSGMCFYKVVPHACEVFFLNE